MQKTATIIVPTTGDRGPLLPFSVGSVLAQSEANIEVFIIGDGVNDDTRSVIKTLQAKDPRIVFFDHEKHERRGEEYRHQALQKAKGRIICYLCDRDYMLPDHVSNMDLLLQDSDFAHGMVFSMNETGILFNQHLDLRSDEDRKLVKKRRWLSNVPLSFVAHTKAAYDKLPYGWRATPQLWYTDLYMWQQFLDQDWCRCNTNIEPTILYFKRGHHPGWPVVQRLQLLDHWHGKLDSPEALQQFKKQLIEDAVHSRTELVKKARSPFLTALQRLIYSSPIYLQKKLLHRKQIESGNQILNFLGRFIRH